MPLYAAIGSKGGVASQTGFATTEGLKVLERGGNAFDAAIVASSILTVILPYTSSIGGDGFLLALDRNSDLVAYNGSGRSPEEFPVDKYLEERPVVGPLTITVPGLVDLWDWTSDSYCSMKLADLLKPAISLAQNGFFVQEPLTEAVEVSRSSVERYESWNTTFGRMDAGSWVNFPRLSTVYTAIANKGADAFYRSKLTEDIVQELNDQGACLTSTDFSRHRGEVVSPIRCSYKDFELCELPPNSQGVSTLQLLKAVELNELGELSFASTERVEKFLSLAASAYEDRDTYVSDPDFFKTPIEKLLSAENMKDRFNRKCNQNALRGNDTTFLVASDCQGNLVGFIQSIFKKFGSGIVAHEIPFQNRATGFALNLKVPNCPAPRKRPLHTLSILLARHESRGNYLIGCAGGDARPQVHAEVFVNIAEYEMSLSKAVEAPRYVVNSWYDGQLNATIEGCFLDADLPKWINTDNLSLPSVGIVHAARRRSDGVLEFVADPRGGGLAASLL